MKLTVGYPTGSEELAILQRMSVDPAASAQGPDGGSARAAAAGSRPGVRPPRDR
jgi:hypothetical protein